MSSASNTKTLVKLAVTLTRAELRQRRTSAAFSHFFGAGSPCHAPLSSLGSRSVTTMPLTKSIHLVTDCPGDVKRVPNRPLQLVASERPLSVILSWLMSEKKHILKYAQFYLDQGFDVLTVRITPTQLLWPTTGSQVVARDLLNFMSLNTLYRPLMIHGFSVGGYLWGEALNIMCQEPEKYRPVYSQIAGQIWDSVVDFEGIPTGAPKAIFPNNAVLRKSLEMYIKTHMAAFHNTATKHYLRSSNCYHNTVVRAPSLFLCSLDDPVGSVSGIRKVADNWVAMGMKVYIKAWESSPHVSHLHHHPEEYKQEMRAFLEMLGLVPYPEKFLLKSASHG